MKGKITHFVFRSFWKWTMKRLEIICLKPFCGNPFIFHFFHFPILQDFSFYSFHGSSRLIKTARIFTYRQVINIVQGCVSSTLYWMVEVSRFGLIWTLRRSQRLGQRQRQKGRKMPNKNSSEALSGEEVNWNQTNPIFHLMQQNTLHDSL